MTYRHISKIKSIAIDSVRHSERALSGRGTIELTSSKLTKRQWVYCSFMPVSPFTFKKIVATLFLNLHT